MPAILGLVLAVAGAAGGFFAVQAGVIGGFAKQDTAQGASDGIATAQSDAQARHVVSADNVAFVEIDPLLISLGPGGGARHLRFRAQVEVPPTSEKNVRKLMPRIVDVLNGYLRALDISDLEDPLALVRLRSQMLRRIQIVAGRDAVHDLLIMDFVLN